MKTDLELRIERSTAMTCLKRAYLHISQELQFYSCERQICFWRQPADDDAAQILGDLYDQLAAEALEHDVIVAKGKAK